MYGMKGERQKGRILFSTKAGQSQVTAGLGSLSC